MNPSGRPEARSSALERAREHSPFLCGAAEAFPDVVAAFLAEGSASAVRLALQLGDDSVERRLRKQRLGLALAVALGDLAGELTLEEVTAYLSDFADGAIEEAVRAALRERIPDAEPDGIAVVAMGKLGSRELNFSSDIDLLLLFDPELMPRRPREDAGEAAVRIGRRMIELLQKRTEDGYVFRVDLRLRPSPEVTPIALPVNAAISYYESSALPWERAAFIRARAAAGDIALGERFLSALEPFIWRRSLDFGVIEDIREVSARIRDHYAQGATLGPGYDLKRGRGGIREVEFFTQIQQMIHGGRDPDLRCPATLDAVCALDEAGWLADGAAETLSGAYRLLRTIEHRVQMIDDAQTHLLPADAAALDAVARLHGAQRGAELVDALRPAVDSAAVLFDSLAPARDGRLSNDPDILLADLRGIGFAEPALAARHIADWRSGRVRSLRSPAARIAFEAMLPTLLREIARMPDPTDALNRLGDIVERVSSGINLYRLLQARPTLAVLLARLLAHAPALSAQLARRPELLDGLIDESSFAPPTTASEFADDLAADIAGCPYDVAIDRARRLINERRFALGVQLIDLRTDPLDVARGYADVAEGALLALAGRTVAEFESAHGRIDGGELVILALGRLGGRALTHASDLDIIYLHTAQPGTVSDGVKPLGPADYFNRLASRITAALSVPTAAGPLYDVDTRLRPEGAKGMLVVSVEAFEAYQRGEAWTWEHMALTRARPVFGSAPARRRVEALVGEILLKPREAGTVAADAARMRDDMNRHKPASGPLDVKLGPGGLVDLEFAVHVLQLTHGVALDPDLTAAIDGLVSEGLLDKNIAQAQELLTKILVVLRLVAPEGRQPAEQTCALIAQICGAADWPELLARHDCARQSVAALWARIKGGQE